MRKGQWCGGQSLIYPPPLLLPYSHSLTRPKASPGPTRLEESRRQFSKHIQALRSWTCREKVLQRPFCRPFLVLLSRPYCKGSTKEELERAGGKVATKLSSVAVALSQALSESFADPFEKVRGCIFENPWIKALFQFPGKAVVGLVKFRIKWRSVFYLLHGYTSLFCQSSWGSLQFKILNPKLKLKFRGENNKTAKFSPAETYAAWYWVRLLAYRVANPPKLAESLSAVWDILIG